MGTKIIICAGANVDIIINSDTAAHDTKIYSDDFSLEELYKGCGDDIAEGVSYG